MYLYFNRNGVLKEIISDAAVREGSYGYDKVYVYFENDAVTSASANIKFSNDTTVTVTLTREIEEQEIPDEITKYRDLKYFKAYVPYQFYSFVLGNTNSNNPPVYSLINGLTEMSISAVINANTVQMQGLVVFMIENSTVVPDTTITEADFQYLLNAMSNKEDVSNKTSNPGDSTTLYATQKLVKLVNISGKTYSETLDFLADVKMPYYYSNGRMYLYKTHDVDWNLYFTSFDAIANKIYIAIFTENIGPRDVGSLTIEKQENKSNTLTDSSTQYPTTHAVKKYIDDADTLINNNISSINSQILTINGNINNINNNNVVSASMSNDEKTLYLTGKANGNSYTIQFQGGGLSQVDWGQIEGNIQDQTDLQNEFDTKVDKVSGKSLSTNDFTTAYKNKLDGIESGAEVNVLEGVQINNSDLTITNKKVNIVVDSSLNASSTNPIQNQVIAELVPNQASSQNQLADKNFVNSSIATNTAYFLGTYNVVSDLSLDYNATESQIITALNDMASTLNPSNNDYVFVQIPVSNADYTTISRIDRYKFNSEETSWLYEYSLNNSSFTASQWAAINSGITSAKVDTYDAHVDNPTIHVTSADKTNWNGKQPLITTGSELDSDLVDDTSQAHKFVTQAMYDYLDNQLYQKPTISVFQLGGTVDGVSNTNIGGTFESGSIIIITGFRHQETNISNISGNLTFNGVSDIGPSATTVGVSLSTSLTITGTTTKTLSGTDTKGNPFSASKSITFISYVYYTTTSSTTTPTTSLTKSVPANATTGSISISYNAGDYIYFYHTASGKHIEQSVSGQWVTIASESLNSFNITKANGATASYYCYRVGPFGASGTDIFRIA